MVQNQSFYLGSLSLSMLPTGESELHLDSYLVAPGLSATLNGIGILTLLIDLM